MGPRKTPGNDSSPQRGRRSEVIGLVGWAVIIAALLLWEGLGLVRHDDRWPTFSDMVRTVTRTVPGRWILFALWLWWGWHTFVRGWRFFLRD